MNDDKKTKAQLLNELAELRRKVTQLEANETARTQAEAALHESEERFRFVLNNSLDAAYRRNLQTDRYDYMSPVIEKVLGWSAEEMNHMDIQTVLSLIHPEDASLIAQEIERTNAKCQATGRATGMLEYRFRNKHGEYHWVGDTITVLSDAQNRPLYRLGIVRDITERKEAEAALRENAERYRNAQKLGQVGNWEYNLQTTEFWGSEEAKRIYGFDPSAEQFTTDEVENCIPERERVHQALVDLIERGQEYHLEFDIITHDRQERRTIVSLAELEHDADGNPLKVTGVIQDITARKQAEETLRESEARFHSTLDFMQEGILLIGRDWRYLYINKAAEMQGRRSAEEMLGKTVMECWPGIEATDFFQLEQQVMQERLPAQIESSFIFPDGEMCWFSWHIQPAMEGLLIVTQDITARKQTEEALHESAQLYQQMFIEHSAVQLLIDPDSGAIVEANSAAARFYGYPVSVLHTMTINQINILSPQEIAQRRQDAVTRAQNFFLFRHRLASGDIRDVEVYSTPIRFKGNTLLYSIIHDITDRKQFEDALRENQEKLNALFDILPIGISILDQDRNILRQNRSLCKILEMTTEGIAKKSYINRTYLRHNGEPMLPEEFPSVQAFEEHITVQDVEIGIIKEDGALLWTNVSAAPLAFSDWKVVVITTDITARKQAEVALQTNESNLKALIENINERVWSVDRNYGLIVGNAIFHQSITHALGRTFALDESVFWLGLDETVKQEWQGYYDRALTGEHFTIEEQTRFTPTPAYVDYAFNPIRTADGQIIGVTVYGHDITARKQAEAALQDSHATLQTLINAIDESVFLLDLHGIVLASNDTTARRLHCRLPQLIGSSIYDALPAAVVPSRKAHIEDAIRTGQLIHFEDQRGDRQIDNYIHPILDEHGQVSKLAILGIDITDRKRAEEALRESEDRYRRIVETTEEGIWVVNTEWKTVFANARLAAMLDYLPEEMVGRHIFAFMDAEGQRIAQELMTRREQGARENHDFKFQRRNGTDVWTILSTNPLTDASGQFIGALAMLTDITERKQMEDDLHAAHQELLEKNAELREANASKDKFFSIIAHDLRSPFSGLLMFTDMLLNQFDALSGDMLKEYLAKLHLSANRLYALLENLLAWARLQRGLIAYQPQPLALAPLADGVVGLFAANAEQKSITLTQAIPAAVMVSADVAMVQTIFRNLISNALKFTSFGGRITLSARPAAGGDAVEIAVADTGCGITPDITAQLFRMDSHHTTTGTAGENGTGLGLLLCHDLVRKHGGALTVESAVGVGTTFRFPLPLASAWTASDDAEQHVSARSSVSEPTAPRPDDTAILPPLPVLCELQQMALIGDILGIERVANELHAQDVRYAPAATRLLNLRKSLQVAQIRKLIEQWLQRGASSAADMEFDIRHYRE